MRHLDENDVIGWLIMVPLIVLIWALCGYLMYEFVIAIGR